MLFLLSIVCLNCHSTVKIFRKTLRMTSEDSRARGVTNRHWKKRVRRKEPRFQFFGSFSEYFQAIRGRMFESRYLDNFYFSAYFRLYGERFDHQSSHLCYSEVFSVPKALFNGTHNLYIPLSISYVLFSVIANFRATEPPREKMRLLWDDVAISSCFASMQDTTCSNRKGNTLRVQTYSQTY